MDKKLLEGLLDSSFPMEESTKYFKALIYGDPGGGKTTLAGTIGNRIRHVEADPEGWQALFNIPELVVPGRMIRMRYDGISQIEALATAIAEGVAPFSEEDTILIDTGSNIAALDLDVVTKQSMKKKGEQNFNFDDDMWANYKQNAHRVRMAMMALFLQPINIVMTAHARDITVKKLGIEYGMKTVPDFSPKILASINGMTSMIGYMTAIGQGVDDDGSVKYTRKLQVHPTKSIIAKTRIGGLPPVIDLNDLWDLRKIVDKWQATGGELIPESEAPMELPAEKDEIETFGMEI